MSLPFRSLTPVQVLAPGFPWSQVVVFLDPSPGLHVVYSRRCSPSVGCPELRRLPAAFVTLFFHTHCGHLLCEELLHKSLMWVSQGESGERSRSLTLTHCSGTCLVSLETLLTTVAVLPSLARNQTHLHFLGNKAEAQSLKHSLPSYLFLMHVSNIWWWNRELGLH